MKVLILIVAILSQACGQQQGGGSGGATHAKYELRVLGAGNSYDLVTFYGCDDAGNHCQQDGSIGFSTKTLTDPAGDLIGYNQQYVGFQLLSATATPANPVIAMYYRDGVYKCSATITGGGSTYFRHFPGAGFVTCP